MKNFNNLQQNIIREEFARACMIQKAQSTLNEHQFSFFINELRDYENNLIITESNQGELLYEGFFGRLKNLAKGAFQKIAPSDSEKLGKLADQLGMIDAEIEVASGDSEKIALNAKARALIKQMAQIDPVAAEEAGKLYNMPGAVDSGGGSGGGESGDGGASSAEELASDPKVKATADKIEATADASGEKLENPKAGSIWSSIVDSYKYAFAANAGMWKNVFGFFNKTKSAPPAKQDDMILKLLMQLLQQQQGGEMKGAPDAGEVKADAEDAVKDTGGDELQQKYEVTVRRDGFVELFLQHHKEDGLGEKTSTGALEFGDMAPKDGDKASENGALVSLFVSLYKSELEREGLVNTDDGMRMLLKRIEDAGNGKVTVEDGAGGEAGGGEEKEKKPLTIRTIQRPIINVIQRVAAAQGIDMSIKQAQSIAIAITKNLSQQMRANGVIFKGDKPAPPEDIKESFMVELSAILNEERLTRDNMQAKMKAGYKKGKEGKVKNSGLKVTSNWKKTAKELLQKIKANGLSKRDTFQDSMEDMKREPNNYIDFLDIAKDLDQLLRSDITKLVITNTNKRQEVKDLIAPLMDVLDSYKQFKVVKIKKSEKGKIEKIDFTREFRSEYVKTKKEIKGLGIKGKAPQKDMSMADAEKGKVNISKTVAKAIQAGGLDQDVAKKIAPILKKKIEKIIAPHIDGDIKYLEEKVNRYVKKVIQEIR